MDSLTTCPLCASGRVARGSQPFTRTIHDCHCGIWELTDQDLILDRLVERTDKWLLSAWLRNRHDRFRSPYLVKDRIDGKLPVQIREPGALQKIDAMLLMLSSRSQGFGSEVLFQVAEVAPLVWARSAHEMGAIIQHLVSSELAARHDAPRTKGDPIRMSLTERGWRRVDELRPLGARGHMGFVAMRFSPELRNAYVRGIVPALQATGYEPYRVDLDHFTEKIDDRIMGQIRRCALMIVDCTEQKQNVYFEAGFALGLGVPVIWSCREDDVSNLHFDVRQYPCLLWKEIDQLRDLLQARIEALYPGRGPRNAGSI